jgi:ferredoxin, 2Fe-2S
MVHLQQAKNKQNKEVYVESPMITITFVSADGESKTVQFPAGQTLMECAVEHMISEIEVQCGGGCACATCHCYPREQWTDKLPEMDAIEECVLQGGTAPVKPTSRLSCQIELTQSLSGLVVDLPALEY